MRLDGIIRFSYPKFPACFIMVPMKQRTPSYIHPASYGKTTIAYLLDAVCTIAMIFAIYYAFGNTVLLPAQNYQASYDEYLAFMADSGLTKGDSSGTLLTYDETIQDGKAGWQYYQEAVIKYYTVFIPGESGAEFYEEDGVSKDSEGKYNVESIKAFVLKKVYLLNADGSQIEEGSDPYFVLDESTEDPYDVKLSADYQGDISTELTKLSKLKSFFANSESRTGAYYDAITHFSAQPHFKDLQNSIGLKRYIAYLPSFIISPLIFFFLIPLLTKDGRTLGKLAQKIAVVSESGYKARKLNIVIHYAILTLVWELLLIPSTMIGIMAMAFLLLIDYLALILSKNHTSLHDKIARTLVIDAKESKWFKDEEEEEQYIKDNPDSSVAGFYIEENGHLPGEEASPIKESPRGLSEDTILDFSTIGKARREAATITSFDEFEKRHCSVQSTNAETAVEENENPANPEDSSQSAENSEEKE